LKGILVVAGLIIAGASLALTQMKNNAGVPSGNDEQELREKLRAWDEAYRGRDIEALSRILADDFLFTSASGALINKMQYLSATIKAPDMTLESFVGSEDVKVRLYAEAAVVTSRGAHRGPPLIRDPAARYRLTDVWVKQQGRWQAVASQATRVQQP
jgi:ketosteroid isomerase-like protein